MWSQPLPKVSSGTAHMRWSHISKIHAWNISPCFSLITSNTGCFLNYDFIFLFPLWFPLAELWILPQSFWFSIFAICFSLNFPQWLNKGDKQKCKASWKVSWGPAIAAFSFVLETVRGTGIRPSTAVALMVSWHPEDRLLSLSHPFMNITVNSVMLLCPPCEAMVNHRWSLIIWGHA